MDQAIITPIKRAILRLLARRGYVLVKQGDYAGLVARANSANAPAPPPPPTPKPVEPAVPPPPPEFVSAAGSDRDHDVERFLERAHAVLGGPAPAHAAALFLSLRYLSAARVPGDIIDCGDGSPTNLALAALALVALADTSRRLVMFDISGDASHRAEIELPLWGSDTSDLSDDRLAELAHQIEAPKALPKELAASGYPLENLRVVRYPADAMDLSRPIAYLGLIADSYDANRAAVRALFPRVTADGVVAVEGTNELRASQPGCVQRLVDAVEQYLAEARTPLEFWRAADRFRVAIKHPSSKTNGSRPRTS